MISPKTKPLGTILLLLALGLAGCGGSDSETSTLTKAELLKKGNAICVKGNEEYEDAFDPFIEEGRDDDLNFAIETVIPMRKKEVRLLRALGQPAEGAERWEELLEAMEEGIERAEKDPHSMFESESHYAFARAFELGIDYGLERCWLS